MTRKKILAIPITGLLITPTLCWSFSHSFGNSGLSGKNGKEGYRVEKGGDITIKAKRQNQFLDPSGKDGSHGEHGSLGENAIWCNQTTPEHNLEGIYGGDGGGW